MRNAPQKQGTQDGACGFYAIGNALSIVFPEIKIDKLFYDIFMLHFKHSTGQEIIEGMGRNALNSLLVEVLDSLKPKAFLHRPFWKSPAQNISEFKKRIFEHTRKSQKHVAIIGYEFNQHGTEEEYHSHWTVIKNASDKSMHTFDSDSGRRFIRFSRCRKWDSLEKHKSRPFKIDTGATFLLSPKNG